MSEALDQATTETTPELDLAAAVRRLLEGSDEPLTLSKIRAGLPGRLRSISVDELADQLRRQVAANVLQQYPKYRSRQDRFWDRPMPVHIANLLRTLLQPGPLAWADLRRKLPDYAKVQAEAVLHEQVAQGLIFRHPPLSKRSGARFGLARPDPREYLRAELTPMFARLEQLGFTHPQLREGALELLHEEEWASPARAVVSAQPTAPAAAEAAMPESRP